MPIVFFLLGALTLAAVVFTIEFYKHKKFLNNRNPNYAAPGIIPNGSFERFVASTELLFPNAPAQSYISIYAYTPNLHLTEETKFFIRSAGKRDGIHSFRGELRLAAKDRHHIMDALPMLEQIGGPLEREDKSHGALIIKTAKLEDIDGLIEIAQEFSTRVLKRHEASPITINWHFAGYHSTRNKKKR